MIRSRRTSVVLGRREATRTAQTTRQTTPGAEAGSAGLTRRTAGLLGRDPADAEEATLDAYAAMWRHATGHALHLEASREWVGAGDGVEMSPLRVEHERERHSQMTPMQPGAWLPAHRHAGPEECLVVRGDLDDGRVRLGADDCIRFEAATQHAVTTRGGCTLFVTASLCDSGVS